MCVYLCVQACVYVSVYMYMCVCLPAFVCMCEYACMYLNVHMCMYEAHGREKMEIVNPQRKCSLLQSSKQSIITLNSAEYCKCLDKLRNSTSRCRRAKHRKSDNIEKYICQLLNLGKNITQEKEHIQETKMAQITCRPWNSELS